MQMENVARRGASAPADLRAWLAFLAERGRLAIAREGIGLADELAAVAKRLERDSAVLFPRPDGHEIPVVANLFAGRDWVADSTDVADFHAISYAGQMVVNDTPVTLCFVVNWTSVDPRGTSEDLIPAFVEVVKGSIATIKRLLRR